jgi:hypothetical protein
LASLGGVRAVEDKGRVGIHHQFDVICDEDLREDVGALAQSRGWALRELSWRRPTLEELFARIALGTHEPVAPAESPTTAVARIAPPEGHKTAIADVPPKVVYNLNPFDMGATRDLGRPKSVDSSPAAGVAGASETPPASGACDPQ